MPDLVHQPAGPGRPRNVASETAIRTATMELLLEVGYQQLRIEHIAARAGVGKSTIYRWWRTKGDLVLDAAKEHLEIGLVPYTGDTRRDLEIAVGQLIRTFTDRVAAIVIFAVIAGLEADHSVAATFRGRWVGPWRMSLAEALRRGVERRVIHANTVVTGVTTPTQGRNPSGRMARGRPSGGRRS